MSVSRFRIIVFVSLALVFGVLSGATVRPGKPVVQVAPSEGVVRLMVYFGDGAVKTWSNLPFVTGQTAFSILEEIKMPIVYDPSTGAGVFVRSIGDQQNGEGGKYWQYWVNAQFALVAADQYMLKPGDTVEWKFAPEQ